MNVHVCECVEERERRERVHASVLNPLEENWIGLKNERRHFWESQASWRCTYNHLLPTIKHAHTYNTPPYSLGSQGHIPSLQSASGFHTLLWGGERGDGGEGMLCLWISVWNILLICVWSCLRVRGRKVKENRSEAMCARSLNNLKMHFSIIFKNTLLIRLISY